VKVIGHKLLVSRRAGGLCNVPVLHRTKEWRQVIIVTHNANIAIPSDVEQIVSM
jgi:hypothetical protein